ncbi:MAG: DUF6868 family protein [Pseudomonadota bacterium]
MITIATLTTFLGWCLLINIGLLVFMTLMLIVAKDFAIKQHSAMFKMEREQIENAYFNYLANYKLLVSVFNLVPYLALKLMG